MEEKKTFGDFTNLKQDIKIHPVQTDPNEYARKYIVPKLKKQNAVKCFINSEDLYKEIDKIYRCTTAYDHITYSQHPSKFTGANSFVNRAKRYWNERYVITEVSNYEMLNYVFTIILMIMTIFLIYYSNYRYNLVLLPKDILKEQKLTKEQEKNIEHYNTIQKSTDIIKGISIAYIVGLSLRRIYKRTTL
jgi:hypothetical protein